MTGGKQLSVRRHFVIERWYVRVSLRVFHGTGQPQFSFEFGLGRPKRINWAMWDVFEDDDIVSLNPRIEGFASRAAFDAFRDSHRRRGRSA